MKSECRSERSLRKFGSASNLLWPRKPSRTRKRNSEYQGTWQNCSCVHRINQNLNSHWQFKRGNPNLVHLQSERAGACLGSNRVIGLQRPCIRASARRVYSVTTCSSPKAPYVERSVKAKKGYGQNFLRDKSVSQSIASDALLEPGDTVLEIGPGTGCLTDELLKREGVRIIAVEADPRLCRLLQKKYEEEVASGVMVLVDGDATRLDLRQVVAAHRQPGSRVKVVANLPFNITTDILKILLPMGDIVAELFVMLQLEAAQRLVGEVSGNSDYRAMSVLVEFYSAAEAVTLIGRECFEPQPRVDCCMVRFKLKPPGERLPVTSEKAFLKFVNVCFSSRRKTLRNNLRAVFSQEAVEGALLKVGLQENVRPQELSAADFVGLAAELYE